MEWVALILSIIALLLSLLVLSRLPAIRRRANEYKDPPVYR